jgi:hypothetical protein
LPPNYERLTFRKNIPNHRNIRSTLAGDAVRGGFEQLKSFAYKVSGERGIPRLSASKFASSNFEKRDHGAAGGRASSSRAEDFAET